VSVYWAYRGCNSQNVDEPKMNNTDTSVGRERRYIYAAGHYGSWLCLNGCCNTVCSCNVKIVEVKHGNKVVCAYYNNCKSGYYAYKQRTPGLRC